MSNFNILCLNIPWLWTLVIRGTRSNKQLIFVHKFCQHFFPPKWFQQLMYFCRQFDAFDSVIYSRSGYTQVLKCINAWVKILFRPSSNMSSQAQSFAISPTFLAVVNGNGRSETTERDMFPKFYSYLKTTFTERSVNRNLKEESLKV